MSSTMYDRLSALDNSFLVFEGPDTHMHVAATSIFEIGPLATPTGGVDINRVRDYIGSRLHRIPRYRQRLDYIPVEGHPVWVDDNRFNLNYHVRHASLPRPGDDRQLKRLAARILSQQLDRGKPLWETWIVEGLQGGRFAMISKTHHCMIDGISGVDLLSVLLSWDPNETVEESPQWLPRPVPRKFDLAVDELIRRISPVYALPELWKAREDVARQFREGLEALTDTLSTGLQPCSETPLNKPIGPHRRFDWTTFDLSEVREVKNRLGGTVNDVVLATVTGAVRRFMQRRRINCDGMNFRVFVPVSVRTPEERGTLGNRVAGWLASLPVDEADPRLRLAKVQATTADLKESKQAHGVEVFTRATEWTPSTVLSVAVRLSTRIRPFNLVVTNVPGPQIPLYLLGARMLEIYPQVPLFFNQGLGIALFSYDGKLCWGLTADWDMLPDLHVLTDAINESFAELQALARVSAAPPAKRRRAVPRKRTGRATSRVSQQTA